jgi:signal transduction histidine kinase
MELAREPTDLVELLRVVASGVQSLTRVHTIRLDMPPTLEGVWDGARLDQVLQNLLTNAVKYSPEGGTIVVRVESTAAGATVSVSDPGLGIPAEELTHVFERFYRAARTRRLEGTGLGLYICKGIIAAHGGRLWVESDGAGLGSTFTFSLPN